MPIGRRTALWGIGTAIASAVFAACSNKPSTAPKSTSAAADADPTTSATTDAHPTPSSATREPSASTVAAPTTTSSIPDVLPAGAVNALVFGTDSRTSGAMTGNTDAIVVAQLSADRTKLTLVSIARDSYVRIGNTQGKINAAFSAGGTDRLKATVSELLGGIDFHLTAQTNFNGFISITRWLKGIVVVNRHASSVRVRSTGRLVTFPRGELTLTNTDALIYARQRKSLPLGDLDRAERHRALIVGMLRGLQTTARVAPATFPALAKNLVGNCLISGPVTAENVADLRDTLLRLDTARVVSLLVPIERFATVGGASVDIVDAARTGELGAALRAGDLAAYVAKYGTDYGLTG